MPRSPKSGRMVMLRVARLCLVLIIVCTNTRVVNAQGEVPLDFTCEPETDNCTSEADGVCDSNVGTNPVPGCENGDCFDCDLCTQFNYDCLGCLATTGCYYCPGDATCNNSPDYLFSSKLQSCLEPTSYLTGGEYCSHTPDNNFFSDPLYEGQKWVYDMINVVPVWKKGYFGNGIHVRVNDDGVDATHPEFQDRFDAEGSCDMALPLQGDSEGHGTSVASIIAGAGDNDKCAAGIAPKVFISSCNVASDDLFWFLSEKLETVDVSQNSWGVESCGGGVIRRRQRQLQNGTCPFEARPDDIVYDHPCDVCDFNATNVSYDCKYAITEHCKTQIQLDSDPTACLDFLNFTVGVCNREKLPTSVFEHIAQGIREGRDGKGIIYVFGSGDGYLSGDDVNFNGISNSRFTITVGGVGKNGLHASYSTPGAALFVTAPGGDFETVSNHMASALAGGCTSTRPSTSFAAPVVSGVIALVIEANPLLTWRDVQGILALTSQSVSDPNDFTVTVNAAGIWHSNLYGFGIINAYEAIAAAENWTLYGIEIIITGESGFVNATIKDDSVASINSTVTIEVDTKADPLIVESIGIFLHLEHFSRGDLEVVLTSPSGTASVILPGRRFENTQARPGEQWELLAVKHWGEVATGDWVLSITDLRSGDVRECANAPFYKLFEDQVVTCKLVENQQLCANGARSTEITGETNFDGLFGLEDTGLTLGQACCACGGGSNSTAVSSMLIQWELVVYGHKDIGFSTPGGSLESSTQAPPGSPLAGDSTESPQGDTRPSRNTNSTDTMSQPSTGPTPRELAIAIAGTLVVLLVVTLAVRWSFKPPASKTKFKLVDETADIA